MGRNSTGAIVINELISLDITRLKNMGYNPDDEDRSGSLFWSVNGERVSSIGLELNSSCDPAFKLKYMFQGVEINYILHLERIESNLKNGWIWLFICPTTGLRARKLYLYEGQFVHRNSIINGMYESQIKSQSYRKLESTFGLYFRLDELYEEIYSKNFKRYYRGKRTGRYNRIIKQIKKIEGDEFDDGEF
ncbi:hypothetical protein N8085_02560 [Salibacteraceae bacterium]|nr:hypothetical protein [Salibacteraceae bacterium]